SRSSSALRRFSAVSLCPCDHEGSTLTTKPVATPTDNAISSQKPSSHSGREMPIRVTDTGRAFSDVNKKPNSSATNRITTYNQRVIRLIRSPALKLREQHIRAY